MSTWLMNLLIPMALKYAIPVVRHGAAALVVLLLAKLNAQGIHLDSATQDALNTGLAGTFVAILMWALSDHSKVNILAGIKAAVTNPDLSGSTLMVKLDNKGTMATITPHSEPAVPPLRPSMAGIGKVGH